jgi:hypothetical protein
MTELEWMIQDIKYELEEMEKQTCPEEDKEWCSGFCGGLLFAIWILTGSPHGN